MLTGAAARLAAVALLLLAAGAAVGAAIAAAGGAVAGAVLVGLLEAAAYFGGARLALSALAARPVGEVEQPGLYRLVRELSKAGRLPVPRLYLSPAEQPNAFTVGRAVRTAAVCCTAGLLKALDETELRAVLGHELAHVSGRDILPGTVSAGLATLITFPAGLVRFLPARAATRSAPAPSAPAPSAPAPPTPAPPTPAPSAPAPSAPAPSAPAPALSVPAPSVPAPSAPRPSGSAPARATAGSGLGLLEATLMLVLGPIAALVIRLTVTPATEYRADATGALLSGEPVALASALRKIDAGTAELALAPDGRLTSVGHLMIASPFRAEGFAGLFRTHPPLGERVRRLEALAGYRR
jgi:Zn-dependent protease with chaperone function